MKTLVTRLMWSVWLLPVVALSAEPAEPTRLFAAPDAAGSPVTGAASGFGQMLLGLVVVLGAVFVVAWLARRVRGASTAGGNGIEVLAQASLGAKEKAVIVRIDGERLLLGVAAGQVNLLKTLSPDAATPPPAVTSSQIASFGALLRKSLGK